ncbi:MAG TPA: hypothetical protein VGB02_19855 [Pyrinomonadaceae bacterium]|jgi:hypothetical protein
MKLSSHSEDYADVYYFKKAREMYREYENDLKNRKFVSFEETERADFSMRAKVTAKMIEARIESYVMAYEKEGLLIEDEDRNEIFEKINKIIDLQRQMIFSGSQGTITMIRNQWSNEYASQMKEYFDSKVKQLIEPALIELNLKMREMKMNKMLEQNQDKQYEVLRWSFEKADGRQYKPVSLRELMNDNSRYSVNELEKISDYLEGERLIEQLSNDGLVVQLTHKGIVEIQNSINNPQKSTPHFPATIIQQVNNYISGNNYGGIHQQTGNNNTQVINTADVADLEQKINELILAIRNSSLSDIQKITTETNLQTIQKLAHVEITPEVSREVESRIVAVKEVLSTTADLVSLGQIILPMIGHFFHIANF